MTQDLPPLRLTGGTVLGPNGFRDHSIGIARGRLARGPFPAIDITGCWVLPGIVDICGTPLDDQAATSPDIHHALQRADRLAASQGVTTGWLTQGCSWEGGTRALAHVAQIAQAAQHHRARSLADLRLLLRLDPRCADPVDSLIKVIQRHEIGFVLFNNFLDDAPATPAANALAWAARARRLGCTPAQLQQAAALARTRAQTLAQRLCHLAERFDSRGVIYGSQADPDAQTRDDHAMLGAQLCAFPDAAQAADVARALGNPIVLSARALLRETGADSATGLRALIARGRCDALASDGDPAALARAAFVLADTGLMPLPRAWALISTAAARTMRLADRGTIETGRRADLCIIDKTTRTVAATIAGGRIIHLSPGMADRFASVTLGDAVAAA
jgi:alpha-D-ribose 1-methylphosphonate 5-triphosphate diphosphatase